MHLVLIETSGNQNFIFSTNKLRENFGASELTYRSCTEWVLQAVNRAGGPPLWSEEIHQLRKNLLDSMLNQPIEDSKYPIEVVLASSGKALLLVKKDKPEDESKLAKQIVSDVTQRALERAPGLDIFGTVLEFDWTKSNLGEISQKIHQQALLVYAKRAGVSSRFLQLPVVSQCVTSGLPAQRLHAVPGNVGNLEARSATSLRKEVATEQAFERLLKLYQRSEKTKNLRFVTQIDELEKVIGESDWLAVIHADGNGLGEIFINFHKHLEANSPRKNRDYVNQIRQFSIALDDCTEQAFLQAVGIVFETFNKNNKGKPNFPNTAVPLIPLILGGDDLTVICGGQYALELTQVFLEAFEAATKDSKIESGIIGKIAGKALGKPWLSACAGAAIVKPHFPFSIAYSLSAQLIDSAKQVKQKIKGKQDANKLYPCSAIDFHVLYDSSHVELKQIRQKLQIDWRSQESQESQKEHYQTRLYGRPLITTSSDQLEKDTTEESLNWAKHHYWTDFVKRVKALKATQQTTTHPNQARQERLLPASQAHELRQGLFLGRSVADARLKLIWQRYQKKDSASLQPLIERIGQEDNQDTSLFWQEKDHKRLDRSIHVTGFLDAMDALEISKTWEN